MAQGKVYETVIEMAGNISPTLGKAVEGVTKKLESVNMAALAAGAAVGGIAIGTGVAVAKATKALANLGDSYNSAVNDISAGTGLVGEELENMSEVLKNVYGSNFGESMEDAAAGITEVYRATGLTDEALAATTKGAYALADTFGYEVAESARAAKAMMTNFGVSGEEAMSMIAAGAQNGLDFSGEFIDSINEYSVQFSKLGFSADEMFNIFQAGADSGAWNLDKVGDAIKEFSIRSIDGSESTKSAFEALGLNADDTMAVFAKGGDNATKAFQDVLTKLMDMDDQVARDALGVQLFGTQWEDLGVDAMKALSQVSSGAYDTEGALNKINEVKYNNLSDAFEAVKRQGEVSLLPLASTIANAFTQIAPVIGNLFERIGPIIANVTDMCMPFITDFLDGLISTIEIVLPIVEELAGAILPLLGEFIKNLLPPLLDLVNKLLPPLIEIVKALLPALSAILLAILPLLTKILSAILPVLVTLLNTVFQVLTPVFDVLIMLVNDVIMPLMDPIMQLVNVLLPLLAPILEGVASALKPVLDLLKPLAEVLGTIVGWISEIVGWVADGLNWVVDLIFGESTDEVAEAATVNGYATGGFTKGLSIAGEDPRYPMEAVISFNPAYRDENLSYWAKAGRMLGADASDFFLGSDGGSGTTIDMGGVTFAPNITITGNADKSTVMQAIEDEYPEFLDMLEQFLVERGSVVYA